MSKTCGEEVAVDWINGLVLHREDADWHSWDDSIYGERGE